MPLMCPISVPIPVATTTPRPAPPATSVLLKAMHVRSPIGASAATGSVDFSTGTDSPVRMASSIRSPAASISRRSAGIFSPASRSTMSPGTTPAPSILRRVPSRRTEVRGAIILRMAAIASSARPSWM
jgi:hypothetical protein